MMLIKMLFMVEIFVFAGVDAGVVIRREVDVCGDQMCDQMRPVCGVVDGELGCTDYNTESAMLLDIDVVGQITVNPIQVSLMVIGGGRLAYWRNLRLRMTFHKDEREAGNLYRVTEDDYEHTYTRHDHQLLQDSLLIHIAIIHIFTHTLRHSRLGHDRQRQGHTLRHTSRHRQ